MGAPGFPSAAASVAGATGLPVGSRREQTTRVVGPGPRHGQLTLRGQAFGVAALRVAPHWPRGHPCPGASSKSEDTVSDTKSGAVESQRGRGGKSACAASRTWKAKVFGRRSLNGRRRDLPHGEPGAECGSPRVLGRRETHPGLFCSCSLVGSPRLLGHVVAETWPRGPRLRCDAAVPAPTPGHGVVSRGGWASGGAVGASPVSSPTFQV